MINIKELRFGNWVDWFNPMSNEFTKHQYHHSDNYLDIEAYCYPIKLTKDILITSGFYTPTNMQDTVFFRDKVMLDFHNGCFVWRDFNVIVSSVHELQNIYFVVNYKELKFNRIDFNI